MSAISALDTWIAELEANLGDAKPANAASSNAGTKKQQQKPNKKEKAKPAQKVNKNKAKPAATESANDPEYDAISKLDIRVGRIVEVWEHPDSEKLFCECIDIGDGEIRNIASGLRPFYTLADWQDRLVVVLVNLKGRNLGGFKSEGMVLCASDDKHETVKFVEAPNGSKAGDRISFPGVTMTPASAAQVQKKKIFEACAPHLRTGADGICMFKDRPFTVDGTGVCSAMAPEGFSVS